MSRKFSIFLVLCIALFGAILAGYWDMLSSERQKQGGETVASGSSGTVTKPSDVPAATVPSPAAPQTKTTEAAPSPAAPETSTAAAPPAETRAAPDTQTAAANSSPAQVSQAPKSDPPRFDLLRVEPDGSAVIAGQAPADSEVRILSGDREIGSAKASREGDFALVLEQRLTVGSHSIRIETKGPDGQTKASQEVAVVSVPRPGNPGDLLAMIEQPGQPSRIIAVPKAETPAAPTVATKAEPPAAVNEQASNASAAASPASAASSQPFAVEAVEIENGTIYIAGRAEGRNPVRVYVDEKLVGEDRNRANDRFLVTATTPLTPGEHRIRADILGPDGKVAARVEVPFTKPESETMSAMASDEPQADADAAPSNAAAPTPPATTAEAAPASAEPAPTREAATTGAPVAQDAPGIGTVVQPALRTVDTRVLIRRGDTLWRISRETYGLGRRYTVIYLANGDQIRNPNRIYPGQLLRLPKHEGESAVR